MSRRRRRNQRPAKSPIEEAEKRLWDVEAKNAERLLDCFDLLVTMRAAVDKVPPALLIEQLRRADRARRAPATP